MLEVWLVRRRNRDPLEQHRSQLDTLELLLKSGLVALRAGLDTIPTDGNSGTVYARCRELEVRLAWLQRVWWYFRRKFDQRDEDTGLARVLTAADEVVWSCYAEVYVNSGRIRPAAPLAYIEPLFSPEAIPRDDPPPELESVDSPFLKQFLAELPVPLIALPPACLEEPWWLAFVAHEVGHHIQHDFDLVGPFAGWLRSLICADPDEQLIDPEANRWGGYGQEIFADLFSVSCLGAAAVRTMVELELAEAADMLAARRGRYPAPLVRLALLAKAAKRLGAEGDAALAYGLSELLEKSRKSADESRLSEDLKRVDQAAASCFEGKLDGLELTLPALAGWDPVPHQDGTLELWSKALREGQNLYPSQVRASSRLLVAASVKAWEALSTLEDAARAEAYAKLSAALVDNLAQSREPGTRAADQGSRMIKPLASKFTDWLMHTSIDQLRT